MNTSKLRALVESEHIFCYLMSSLMTFVWILRADGTCISLAVHQSMFQDKGSCLSESVSSDIALFRKRIIFTFFKRLAAARHL